MNAQEVTFALNGHWSGHTGRALCPVCGGNRNNLPLSIAEGMKGPLIYCHKGCDFRSIANALRDLSLDGALREQETGENLAHLHKAQAEDTKRKADQARRYWLDCLPIAGSLASNYLAGRGIDFDASNLAFHPAAWHGPTAHRYPAMIALVEGGGSFAVHRTYLHGSEKAEIAPNKMALGAIAGGAVRLATEKTPLLIVGEGIESTLSFAQMEDRLANVWAALSTSGLVNLRLPRDPGHLIIAQDGDAPGREAAQKLAHRAYARSWTVKIADPCDGCDFNDILIKGTAND